MRVLNHVYWPHCVEVKHREKVTPTSSQKWNESLPRLTVNDERVNWCHANVGQFRVNWMYVTQVSRLQFYFKEEKDATMFALRWIESNN
jgi:hypothetical protein